MVTYNGYLLKVIFSLFALNSFSLYLYFYLSSYHGHKPPPQSGNRYSPAEINPHLPRFPDLPVPSRAKPWPILPSYLPWSQNPNVSHRSCEGYFGNGFTRSFDIIPRLESSVRGKSWFRCLFSETLKSSICEGGGIRMVQEKIRMSVGGESLEAVMGRGEDEEMPAFESGAFSVESGGEGFHNGKKLVGDEFLEEIVPGNMISKHAMRDLIDSIRVVGGTQFQCSEWIEEPVLLVTRFEYANLFHTVTDWYSAYVASRVTGLPTRPHVIFVDGHCEAPLEETWKAMFSSIRYAKNFSTSVCFRHVVLSPLGYETALFKGLTEDIQCQGTSATELWQHPDNKKTARLAEFGEMVKASFGFPLDRHIIHKPISFHNILFVRREDYLAHPRHNGIVQSRLSNEQEVFDSVKNWASKHRKCKLKVVNGLFAHMSMKEQLRAIEEASVIIGAHGAGMTHIICANPNTVVLEIISSQFMRPHFKLIAQWKGLDYDAIHLAGSVANSGSVIERLKSILSKIGC